MSFSMSQIPSLSAYMMSVFFMVMVEVEDSPSVIYRHFARNDHKY